MVCGSTVESGEARVAYVLDTADAVDSAVLGRAGVAGALPVGVIRDQRPRLPAVDGGALLHGFLAVVDAQDQVLAGDVVFSWHARRVVLDVVRASRGDMHSPPAHAPDDRTVGNTY